jgi:excisionase family DNA binding protein
MSTNNKCDIPPGMSGVIATLIEPYVDNAKDRVDELFAPRQEVTLEELWTRKEASQRLKISLPTLDRMIKCGEVSHVKIRRSVRIPRSAVEQLMQAE